MDITAARCCRFMAGITYACFLAIDRFLDIQFLLKHQTLSEETVNHPTTQPERLA